MELSPRILKMTASAIREAGHTISSSAEKVEVNSFKAGEVIERVKVPVETWNAYTINPVKAGIAKSFNKNSTATEESIMHLLKINGQKDFNTILPKSDIDEKLSENFINKLKLNGIKNKDIAKYIEEKSFGGTVEEAIEQGIYTKESVLKDLVNDVQNHSKIKSHPIFAPYNLTLSETAEVSEILNKSYIQTDDITKILKRKDSNLFEALGGDKSFDEINGVNEAYKSLQKLQKNIGENSIKHTNNYSDIKELNIPINGERKSFLYSGKLSGGTLKVPKIGKTEIKTLIESNMLTKDLLENPEVISYIKNNKDVSKLLSTAKINYETPAGELVKIKTDFMSIVDKTTKNGIDSLSTNEVHALTDGLATVYEHIQANDKVLAEKIINKYENKAESIYNVIQEMKSSFTKTGAGKINPKTGLLEVNGQEYKDHFFMRMIDRNLANLTDNSTEKIFNLEEVIGMVSSKINKIAPQKTGNFNANIDGVQGHGIKIIGAFDNYKPVIDSVMQ